MTRKLLLVFCVMVTVTAVAFASYAFLQMKVIAKDLGRFEEKSNNLQEEVLRLQELAIEAEAAAMQAQKEANRWRDEAEALQVSVEDCQ